jgi:hypothetical protein
VDVQNGEGFVLKVDKLFDFVDECLAVHGLLDVVDELELAIASSRSSNSADALSKALK